MTIAAAVDHDKFYLLIQTNSPGELTAWVRPIVETFKRIVPNSHIILFLTPCPYASGQEQMQAAQIGGVDAVMTWDQTLKQLLGLPYFKKKYLKGAVLFLGGDPFYSQLLGFKYRLPVYGYTDRRQRLGLFYRHVFYQHVVGDLMAERARALIKTREDVLKEHQLPDSEYAVFFCGSRPQHFELFFPFMLETVKEILVYHPNFSPLFVISPFIQDRLVDQIRAQHAIPESLRIVRADSLEMLRIASLLITLPGTNTAEAMYLGVPMLIFVPLNNPERIILDGLVGLLGKLPVIGKLWMKLVVSILKKQNRFYSLPNRLAGRQIVPEIVGELESKYVARVIMDWYLDKARLAAMRDALKEIVVYQPVAELICRRIYNGSQR